MPQVAMAQLGSRPGTSRNVLSPPRNQNECSRATARSKVAGAAGAHESAKEIRPSYSGGFPVVWALAAAATASERASNGTASRMRVFICKLPV